jgi:hypothetical protein
LIFSPLDWVFVVAGLAVNLSITVAMFRKGLHRRFPAVTARFALNFLSDAVGLTAFLLHFHYAEIYFVGWFLCFGVELLAIAEVTRDAFPDFRIYTRSATAILAVAAALAALTLQQQGTIRLILERGLAVFECLLLTLLAAYLFAKGRAWRQYSHAFVVCVGLAAFFKLTISGFQEMFGWSKASDQWSTGVQLLALVGWLFYVLKPAVARSQLYEQELKWVEERFLELKLKAGRLGSR